MPRRISQTIRPATDPTGARGSGGLNLSTEPDQLPPNEFPHLLNYDVRERKVLKTRGGSAKVLSTKITTNALTSEIQYEFRRGGSWHRGKILSDGATLWKVTNTTKTQLGTGYVAGSTWRGCVFQRKIFLCNGLNPNMVWDGTTLREMGVIRPSFTATEVVTTSGTLSAVTGFSYKFTYSDSTNVLRSSEGENYIATTGAFTSKKVEIAALGASAQAHVDMIDIWRTTDGGSVYFLVVSQSDATATYDDETTDVALQLNTAMIGACVDSDGNPTNDPPPCCQKMVSWQERLWMAGRDDGTADLGDYGRTSHGYVYYSRADLPEYVPGYYAGADYYNRIPIRSRDSTVNGIAPAGDHLWIASQDTGYRLYGSGETSFLLERIRTTVGCHNLDASCVVGSSVIFFGSSPFGLYRWDGGRITNLTLSKMHDSFNPPAGDTAYWEPSRYEYVVVAHNSPANQIWISLSKNGSSVNDRVLVLQLGVAARWTMYDLPMVKMSVGCGVHESGVVDYMYGVDRFGFLWRYDTGTDDGVPSGTQSGTATAGGNNTLTDSAATFYTTNDGLAGVKVRTIAGTGLGQTNRISSNTATVLTFEDNWVTNPSTDTTYVIGAIDQELKTHFFDDMGRDIDPRLIKKWRICTVEIDSGSYAGDDEMTINTSLDSET